MDIEEIKYNDIVAERIIRIFTNRKYVKVIANNKQKYILNHALQRIAEETYHNHPYSFGYIILSSIILVPVFIFLICFSKRYREILKIKVIYEKKVTFMFDRDNQIIIKPVN